MNIAKKTCARLVLMVAMVVMCLALATTTALGYGYYEYTTDSFDVDVVVHKDNTYAIKEKISVDFAVDKHGIYRYIPIGNFKDMGYMTIKDIYVDGYNYEYYTESDNMVVQIGDGSVYVNGPQEYNISYNMQIYEDRDESRDFFYLDLVPTGWETPIKSSSVTIHFPKKIDKKDIDVYVGGYGATSNADADCVYDSAKKTLTIDTGYLQQGEGVTVFCELPEGYWEGEAGYGWAKAGTMALGVALPILIVALWFLFGRDKKIIPIVEFYPPEGMTPAEVGYVIDGQGDKKDLLSLIMYFGDKGYISIEEEDKKEFVITKLKEIDGNEKNFVQSIFRGLFTKGDVVRVSELDEDFGDNFLTAQEQLFSYYYKKNNRQFSIASSLLQLLSVVFMAMALVVVLVLAQWYSGVIMPTIMAAAAIFAGLIALCLAMNRSNKIHTISKVKKVVGGAVIWILLGAAMALYSYVIATMIELVWFTAVLFVLLMAASVAIVEMRQRTKKSVELMGRLLGLKNFIETAELDRINMLVEENPNYFFNVLPYAYVMGLTDKWAKHFESIKITQPTWYTSRNDIDMFDVWVMSRMMNNCSRSVASNIRYTVAEDSGSGGGGFSSGGGGFSGGGFGGGGGGSW